MAEDTKTIPLNETGASAPQLAKAEGDKPADVTAASTFDPSGAPQQTVGIDAAHPAVDANPREFTTVDQNRIDFNDPTISGSEAVRRNLEAQGIHAGPADDDISRKD